MKIMRRGLAMLLSVALTAGLVLSGMLIRAVADTALQWNNATLGELSQYYETGKSNDPGIISTVSGDSGGKSYGAYMFASNAGTPRAFAEWCKSFANGTVYHSIGVTLDDAYHYISDGYGAYFDAAWVGVANAYGSTFLSAQRDYVQATFYDKLVAAVSAGVPGFDIDNYSVALQNVFWSRAVQHGVNGAYNVVTRAFAALGGFANQPEGDLIAAIYAECSKLDSGGGTMSGLTARKYAVDGKNMSYYSVNSGAVQVSVYRRLAVNEPADALVMLMNNGYSGAPKADGTYQLLLNANSQTLAIDTTSGIKLEAKSETAAQQLMLNYYAGGYYTISSGTSRLTANADGSVSLAAASTSNAQFWTLETSGSGYTLKNRSTGKFLSYNGDTVCTTGAAVPAPAVVSTSTDTAVTPASTTVSAATWQLMPVSAWTMRGVLYPDAKNYLMAQNSSFPVRGVISCASPITSVIFRVTNHGSGTTAINVTASPNTFMYDLKKLDDSITYSKLGAGTYDFTLIATSAADSKPVTLASSTFTVAPYDSKVAGDETFTVTFDPGAGTLNGSATKTVKLEYISYGTLPTASLSGSAFLGWFTSDGTQITENSLIQAGNLTLTARYSGIRSYTFLNAAGGTFVTGTAAEGALIPAPSTTPVKSPDSGYTYTFSGWKDYTSGITVMGSSDVTFTPTFTKTAITDSPGTSVPDGSSGYWAGITPGTSVSEVGGTVYRGSTAVTSGNIATGMSVVSGGKTWTLVVTGDPSGDGKCSISDVVYIQSHLLGKTTLTGAALQAADLNGDGKVTISDLVKSARVVVGKDTIG